MFACLDVSYHGNEALSAAVLFLSWTDAQPFRELMARLQPVAPYVSGEFYKRELPCLLAVLTKVDAPLETVIIDGYVWLSNDGKPGLGAYLYEALGRRTAVIGVSKTIYHGAPSIEVRRGKASRPLYISAAGMEPEIAAQNIQRMHGAYRIPTLLKRVDGLCRNQEPPLSPRKQGDEMCMG